MAFYRSTAPFSWFLGAASRHDDYYDGWRVVEEHDVADAILQQYTYGNYLDEVWTLDDRRSSGTVAQLNDGVGAAAFLPLPSGLNPLEAV